MIERNRKAGGVRLPDGNSAAKPMQLALTIESNATDMNARQMARLDAAQVTAFNRVFRPHRDVLAYLGYNLIDKVC